MSERPERFIFLSHSSSDKQAVLDYAAFIESRPLAQANRIRVWVDRHNIREGDSYRNQFAETLDADSTCGFILYVPRQAVSGWVAHEIKRARGRHFRDAARDGRLFPIFYVYPGPHSARPAPPEDIEEFTRKVFVTENDETADDILRAVIAAWPDNDPLVTEPGFTSDKKLPDSPTVSPLSPPAAKQEVLRPEAAVSSGTWLCFYLYTENLHIHCEDAEGNVTRCQAEDLLSGQPLKIRQALFALFPWLMNQTDPGIERVRIMTDEAAMALLPWESLLADYHVEISPVRRRYQSGFARLSVSNPLVIIPNDRKHQITAGQHFTLLQHGFSVHLGLQAIPRITTVDSLRHDLRIYQPDLIYIYAGFEQQRVQLDDSALPGGNDCFALEELGQWMAEAGLEHPLVIACLAGEKLDHYPQTLVKQARLVWIQSSDNRLRHKQMGDQLLDHLADIPRQADLVKLIHAGQQRADISSHVWVDGPSPLLEHAQGSLSMQLRLALLRVMLGRETLKQTLFGSVTDRNNSHAFMVYAVSGDPQACPFDFPEQLQQRLEDWTGRETGLPVIAYHFPVAVNPRQAARTVFEAVIDDGLYRYTSLPQPDIAFEAEFVRRHLHNTLKGIALNWYFRIPAGEEALALQWLETWRDFIHQEVAGFIPPQTILLVAVCLEVADESQAQILQDRANDLLYALRQFRIRLLRNPEALGKLPLQEISEFLEFKQPWREQLRLDELFIDPHAFASWVHQQTGGRFEDTVKLIWQQYQNNYQDYLAT
ncbi:MAG: toll/interleukin-1 receptor domain-containing protein [Thiolinea sp.]